MRTLKTLLQAVSVAVKARKRALDVSGLLGQYPTSNVRLREWR